MSSPRVTEVLLPMNRIIYSNFTYNLNQSLYRCQAIILESSDSCQAVVTQLSGSFCLVVSCSPKRVITLEIYKCCLNRILGIGDYQGCRKVWKSGRALTSVVGIIFPYGQVRVKLSAPPPACNRPDDIYKRYEINVLMAISKFIQVITWNLYLENVSFKQK